MAGQQLGASVVMKAGHAVESQALICLAICLATVAEKY